MSDSLRRKAASLVLTGFEGATPEQGFDELLDAYPFCGFIFFDRNSASLEQLRALTDRLRGYYRDLPPILAIDQEGGRVMRLREGVAPIPPAAEIGATGDAQLAESLGAQCGRDLRRAGCNVNFAPVLDLAVDPRNTVIGSRSFGADPELVTRLGSAFARGLESAGIVATYKHFPGHGATEVDSHLALPVIHVDEATLRSRDFVPFARVARQAAAMMSAHVVVAALDSQHPATLSPVILQNLLRDEFGFSGVCFSDCLQMNAISQGFGSVDGGVAAMRAGCDVLTISHDPALAVRIVDGLVRAVERGELEGERLDEASERVTKLRRRLQLPL
jgi:beta-N-acetylhexosaminidase